MFDPVESTDIVLVVCAGLYFFCHNLYFTAKAQKRKKKWNFKLAILAIWRSIQIAKNFSEVNKAVRFWEGSNSQVVWKEDRSGVSEFTEWEN